MEGGRGSNPLSSTDSFQQVKATGTMSPALSVIGRIPLRDLTVQDVRTALATMAVTHSTPPLQKAHNYRHAARPRGPSVAGADARAGGGAAGTRARHANVTSWADSNGALNTAGRPDCLPSVARERFPVHLGVWPFL